MANQIVAGNSSNGGTAISTDTSGTLNIVTGSGSGATAISVDTSQNVGIGATTVGAKLHVSQVNTTVGALFNGTTRAIRFGFDTTGSIIEGVDNTGVTSFQPLSVGGADVRFTTSGTERARIDTSGNFLVGGTSYSDQISCTNGSNSKWSISANATAASGILYGYIARLGNQAPNNTNSIFSYYTDNSAARCIIYSNGGIANYQANNSNLSDQREKTNFSLAGNYLDKICAIPVKTFNYIDQNIEEDDGLTLGVIAQDVQAVAPELVTENNFGTEDNPKIRLSIYQTDLQYALMKSIQELKAELDALKAKVGE